MIRTATPLGRQRISQCRGQGTAIASIRWRGISTPATHPRINLQQQGRYCLRGGQGATPRHGQGASTTAGALSPLSSTAPDTAANDSSSSLASAPGRGSHFRLPGFYKQRRMPILGGKQSLSSNFGSYGSRSAASGSNTNTTFARAHGVHTVASIVHPPSGRTTSDPDTKRSYSSASPTMYTASFAFFEAIWDAGVTHCFVNLGSDHPSIIEAMVKGQRENKGKFPRIITCPNEVRSQPSSPVLKRYTLLSDMSRRRWSPCPWQTATPVSPTSRSVS